MLLVAAAVSVLIGAFVPFGDLLLYPFTLLATWVHEMGHGITALAVGGSFEKLEIFANGSGLAFARASPGVRSGLISLGGLVATPLVGAAILAIARGPRRAWVVLAVLAGALLVSVAVWVRTVTGVTSCLIVASLLAAVARWGGLHERMVLAQFLGLRLAIDTMGRGMDYLFRASVVIDGKTRASDIASVAEGLGGPRLVWSALVALVSIGLVILGLRAAWRKAADVRPSLSRQ
jgi:hypothetical protein